MKSVRITNRALEGLVKSPASGTKKLIWDRDVVGFGAYMTSSGSISFLYQYRFRGSQTKSIKIGNLGELTCDQARKMAAGLAMQKLTGIDPVAAIKAERVTKQASVDLIVANYFDGYAERRRLKDPISVKQMNVFKRDLVAHIGHLRLDELTTEQVDAFERDLAARGPSMVRSGLVCLRTVINDAVKRGKILRHEAHNFDVPGMKKRTRRIDEWEFLRMFEAARDIGDVRSDVLEVLFRMAKRKEEIAELRWEELDLAKGTWHLPQGRTKSRRPHMIELPRQVVAIIKRQQPDPAKRRGFVFTMNGASAPEMGSQVKDLLDANLHRRIELATPAGSPARQVDHYTIHDWRKIAVTVLRERPFSVGKDVLNAILLHSTMTSLDETYILATLEIEAGEALQTWNDHLDQLLARADAFPGGRALETMGAAERKRRLELIRTGWPKRADQERAEVGRDAKEEARKRRRRRPRTGE
ncbi:tyrosine-type recombinase/integrase [Sphingomonas adhaesiva]|uniref:Tyr recombinase domain-containing protein n=1 Tax=Sphingomonas adhaesiva TaxID=28212 RepID=A0A2A4IAY6_9SPHN|nr:integrase arm-type DNA-binding domain-containing protein [Sphingomonas adhaesiva]PCG15761.1 hypothetical protein COA07_01915 [Sphingomonas adhaesiva]